MVQRERETMWEVRSRHLPSVVVRAPNWMVAVGLVLERHGINGGMAQVACEQLPNGAVIVNDISTGLRLSIQPCENPAALTTSTERPLLDWMLDCVRDISLLGAQRTF